MLDVLIDMTALNTPSRERGIGRYVTGLCRALALRAGQGDAGAELRLGGLTRHHGAAFGAVDESLQFAGDPAIRIGNLQYQRHKLERRLFLGGLVRRIGPRLLHLPDPPGTPWRSPGPRVVTCHDLIPLVLAKQYLAPVPGARALQWARDFARYRTAERVIAISQATRTDLIRYLGVPADRVDVVYSGVDHERFNARVQDGELERLRARLGFSQPFLLCLGASDARKNLPRLLHAYALSGIAPDIKLVFAGPISKRQRERLDSVITERNIAASVHVLGYFEDELLASLYRHCLAYVFPSSYEGFGLPILEAMACGSPTLTSSLSALGEIAGEAALTMPDVELESMVAGITRIASDGALRAALRERGLAHVQAFTWDRCARETALVYERTLG